MVETVDGAADLPARNLPQREEFHATSLASIGRFALDEERFVLSKLVVQFSFNYGVSRGIFIFVYTSITSLFIVIHFK